MTIDTCSALSGRTPQSKRRGHKAANADGALEVDRLRIVVRIAKRHCRRASRDQRAEDPLHPLALAEASRAVAEPVRRHRTQPAAESAGQDVERPMHADHRARKSDK